MQATFLSFEQGNVNAMHGKLKELDKAFRHEIVSAQFILLLENENYIYLSGSVILSCYIYFMNENE